MDDITPRLTVRDVFGYVLAYMCWISTAAIGMLAVLQLRNTINVFWPVISDNKWLLRPIDRFGLVLMGLAWLVYVIFVEQHYRSSITLARERRFKARTDPNARPIPPPQGRLMKMLTRLGLDVLAMRFILTLIVPLVVFVIARLLQDLAFSIIGGG